MTNTNTSFLLEKISEEVIPKQPTQLSLIDSPVKSGVYLFFSFDLANSTAFKSEHPSLWAEVFTIFYNQVLECLGVGTYYGNEIMQKSQCTNVRKLWKLIGDEVLIYVQINTLKEMYYQVAEISQILGMILPKIAEKMQISKDIEQTNDSKLSHCTHCQDTSHILFSTLGIKATSWIAECYESPLYNKTNIIYAVQTPEALGTTFDFIGRDIDEGFRVAKFAVKNKLIISPMLGWLIWKWGENDYDNSKIVDANIKITAFSNMKGVWKNRKVPIVMFSQKFSKFPETLEYDELDLEAFSNINDVGFSNFLTDERFQLKRLDTIFKNINRINECIDLYQKLSLEKPRELLMLSYTPEREFHIACILMTDDDKVLLHIDKERGHEFGCAKYKLWIGKENWKEACEDGYKKKYSLNIETDSMPFPIATYNFNKEKFGNTISTFGLIVLANLKQETNDLTKLEDWKLYTKEEALSIKGKVVDNFFINLTRAFDIARVIKKDSEPKKGEPQNDP